MKNLLTRQWHVRLNRWAWRGPVWGVLLAFAVVAIFSRLGVWQLDRANEKELLTARYEARRQLAPMDLPSLLRQGQDIDDFPVRLYGHYDNSRQVFLDNQPHGGRAGLHVFTLFIPEGDLIGILVNRGWVSVGADMQRLPEVAPASSTMVSGTVAMPSPLFTVGAPDYSQKPVRVGRLEIAQLSDALGVELRPFVVRLDAAAPDGFIRDWAPSARLGISPEKHRAYAFQWFSLAVAVLAILLAVNLGKRNSAHE